MTTDSFPATVSAGCRPRFSMGQLMALIGALAAVLALYSSMARQAAALNGPRVVDPIVLSASIVVASIAVAALRRSSMVGTLLAMALSASALALLGGLRQTPFGPFGPPAFALLTVAVPLWIRRELGSDPSARQGWSRRLVLAGRVGLDSALNLLGLVVLLMVFEAVGNALPPSSSSITIGSGPNVYASSSSMVNIGAYAVPASLFEPSPGPITPVALPELAPVPPDLEIEYCPSDSEFAKVGFSESNSRPPSR